MKHCAEQVVAILSERMNPQRSEQVEKALRAGCRGRRAFPGHAGRGLLSRGRIPAEVSGTKQPLGESGRELDDLARQYPAEVSWKRLSEDFGVPHPALAQSYSRELMSVKPFPAFMGYSSRLLAESWDSNNLYWARLADEKGYSPAMLNRLVPELTYRMVEKIFATDFEDWPAMLRAMRETADEFRQGKITLLRKWR